LARVTGRQRRDVGDERSLVHIPAFLVEVDRVIREVFFPRLLVPGDDAVEKLLRTAKEFLLSDRVLSQAYSSRTEKQGQSQRNKSCSHDALLWCATKTKCQVHSAGAPRE